MSVDTHAEDVGDRERDLRRQLADLARHAPALFSDAVRYSDHLRRHGCDRLDASEHALAWARDQWHQRADGTTP